MKTSRIANAVGYIDDDLITAAAESKKKTKRSPWLKWGSIAACFALLVIAGTAILPSLFGGDRGTTDKYKDFIQAGESAIIWPWEYQTVYEKYTELKFDGIATRVTTGIEKLSQKVTNLAIFLALSTSIQPSLC